MGEFFERKKFESAKKIYEKYEKFDYIRIKEVFGKVKDEDIFLGLKNKFRDDFTAYSYLNDKPNLINSIFLKLIKKIELNDEEQKYLDNKILLLIICLLDPGLNEISYDKHFYKILLFYILKNEFKKFLN
jgi:hypothetical protein